jgi:bifunctional non-homologous end joining protein LigD
MDFDPQIEDFDAIRESALLAGDLYRECGLEPFAMVTGSRGIHVVAPLKRTTGHAALAPVVRAMAAELVRRDPDRLTTEFTIANRGERIYVDAGRVRWGHTAVAPYSVRARPGAPVATPLRWEELSDPALRADGWTLRTLPGRLAAGGDPWAAIGEHARTLTAARKALHVT